MYTKDEAVEQISQIIDTKTLESAVISNPVKKGGRFKVKVRRVSEGDTPSFQLSEYIDTKVFHKNCGEDELIGHIIDIMSGGFKQCSFTANNYLTVLMNKRGEFKLTGIKPNTNVSSCTASHNREKNYILKDGELVPWMYKLGLMDKAGIVVSHKQKKFRQINRFLEMLRDVEEYIPKNSTIVDMGCGKSYLTFAMYHYLNKIKQKNVQIMGFDLKKDVVDYCNSLTEQFGFNNLTFYGEDIANIDNIDGKISMIITLHACDTATDIALYHGIRWGCKVIMSVPCCQHELNYQIKNPQMDILLKYGIIKERFSALMTDAIRAEILEIKGYKTSVMEFIDMEHTPKNIMIRAVKTGTNADSKNKIAELSKLMNEYNIKQTLFELCFNNSSTNK